MREKRSTSFDGNADYRGMKKPEFRSKKMRVQTAGEVRYNGIPNAPDIMEFAKCIVRNVHELDKVLERWKSEHCEI